MQIDISPIKYNGHVYLKVTDFINFVDTFKEMYIKELNKSAKKRAYVRKKDSIVNYTIDKTCDSMIKMLKNNFNI